MKPLYRGALATAALVVGLASVRSAHLWYNVSPSEPIGIYRELGQPTHGYQRGMFVSICLPKDIVRQARAEAIPLPPGTCPGNVKPLIKRVEGLPGDIVTVDARGVAINGTGLEHSAPLSRSSAGAPLERYAAHSIVPPGKVWVTSFNPLGYDSRYFGPVVPGFASVPLIVVGN